MEMEAQTLDEKKDMTSGSIPQRIFINTVSYGLRIRLCKKPSTPQVGAVQAYINNVKRGLRSHNPKKAKEKLRNPENPDEKGEKVSFMLPSES